MSDHERYLAAYRATHGPSEAESARAWAALATRARAGAEVTLADEAATTPSTWSRPRVAVTMAACAAAAAAVWLATRTPQARLSGDAPPAPAAAVDERDAGTTAIAAPRTPPAEPPPPAIATPAVAPAVAPAIVAAPREGKRSRNVEPIPSPSLPPEPAPASEPSFDAAEVTALRRAQALLGRDPQAALAQLERHAERYPGSSLAAERDAARVAALCNLDRVDDARRAAAAFERAHAGSPLLARVRATCDAG
ncbi:MAG: hypothetical protein K1X88_12900 [Nannocystaceae bacterium]|nr:hypothetical protein [Nannocystaceae bacterium]